MFSLEKLETLYQTVKSVTPGTISNRPDDIDAFDESIINTTPDMT